MKKLLLLCIFVVIVVGGMFVFSSLERGSAPITQNPIVSPQPQPISSVTYQCDKKKAISAAFYDQKELKIVAPGAKSEPTGWVELTFPDTSTTSLAQTISADGGRYENADGSLVFWSKGRGAMVLENDVETNYINCIEVNKDTGGLAGVHHSGASGFTVRYPSDFTSDETYVYTALGSERNISGVKFTIPQTLATGTNLSAGTYISVESFNDATECIADLFLGTLHATATNFVDGGLTYSAASSSEAGAGNRYEETVFALPGTSPCLAVRYFVHYSAFENYASGTVREFDRQTILSQFDAIRRSVVVGQMVLSTNENNVVFVDFKNGTYRIGDKAITLVNGISELAQAGSEEKIITKYFGNEITSDVNGDTVPDVIFLLTQSSGGSGTFFYVVAALATEDGFTGTNGLLLGDRIAPQNIVFKDEAINVNFADRAPGEPMSATASVGVTKRITVKNGVLVEQR